MRQLSCRAGERSESRNEAGVRLLGLRERRQHAGPARLCARRAQAMGHEVTRLRPAESEVRARLFPGPRRRRRGRSSSSNGPPRCNSATGWTGRACSRRCRAGAASSSTATAPTTTRSSSTATTITAPRSRAATGRTSATAWRTRSSSRPTGRGEATCGRSCSTSTIRPGRRRSTSPTRNSA